MPQSPRDAHSLCAEAKERKLVTYRVGLPFWKSLARAGVQMSLRIEIKRDDEVGVYIGYSPDLDGLIVEAKTLDELRSEALGAADMLLELALKTDTPPKTQTEFHMIDGAHCAA